MLILLLILEVMNSSPAIASDVEEKTKWFAEISRPIDETHQIRALQFLVKSIPVVLKGKEGNLRPLVQVKGQIKAREAKLFIEDKAALYPVIHPENFMVYLYLNSVVSELDLQVQYPDGKKESEKITLLAPDIQEYHIGNPWGDAVLSLGSANIKYKQTRFGDFFSVNGLMSIFYQSPNIRKKLTAVTEAEVTVWTIKSSPIDTAPQILRGQLYFQYAYNSPYSPYPVLPLFGVSYLTLFSNGSKFGFANLLAPEFGARVKRVLNPVSTIIAKGIYIPYSGLISLEQVGIDLSLTYARTIKNRHRVEVSFGNTYNTYRPKDNKSVSASFFYFKVGYSF